MHRQFTCHRSESTACTGSRSANVTVAPIAIHGKGVAALAVKQGMVLTRYEGNLWHAVANSVRPRRKPPTEELGNALQWEAEPMIDRLNKCLGVLVGYDLVTDAVHKKIRDQISELRQEANDD